MSKNSKIKDNDLRNTINLVFTTTITHHKLFSWLLRGLDKSDEMDLGWVGMHQVWSEKVRSTMWTSRLTSRWTSSRTKGGNSGSTSWS